MKKYIKTYKFTNEYPAITQPYEDLDKYHIVIMKQINL